ncbi:MAG TPA: adenylate/guanylate cyclase domain-containing protein [Leptospiraceae bacterium]|nr:adenylate/guanylate cyclase domain-containing protein [Leptospiraceae bacterium]HMW07077.1 adenylate/guanylate cyclase domain-containing protein [Leptospiraceae bacterium]HMX34484.1 adenylate/guanylate cyclase domain-containing protein [Leptospiraceae bacterium]HMY33750.1 adenylate/guanylate cyclase domain-containing protein [Leptospiraceae bacterium]HMZ66884.1 adenylate/guanylate cyclase domain-containing protein [Leptospiraceae bacterium]
MKQKLISILVLLIGDFKKNSLEHRLFNSIALANGIINIFGSFGTFYLPNFLILFSLNFGTGIVFLILYYLARFKSIYYILYWPLNLTILFFLAANWFTNGGSLGGSHYYLIPALVIATILVRNNNIIFVYAVYSILTLALFGVEYYYPQLITMFDKNQDRYLDASINYAFVQLFTGFLIFILSRNLDLERKKSDKLLLNILPEKIANELKQNDKVVPARYTSVSVLFTDMAGFTKIAENMSPEELLFELDTIFSVFDSIVKKYGVEKIKTIGDAYMAAGGIPIANETNAVDTVLCALEFREYMNRMKIKKQEEGKPFFELRIGIHTGSLVAGVIGHEKIVYDIWGDTVNTASRMESSGLIGEVNISSATYYLIKDQFDCEYRGKISAKNKGEIDMYLVKGKK